MFHNVRSSIIGFRCRFKSDIEQFVGVVVGNFQQTRTAFIVGKQKTFSIYLFHKSFLCQGKPVVFFTCFKLLFFCAAPIQ